MFKTKADLLVDILMKRKEMGLDEVSEMLDVSKDVILSYSHYLEEAGILALRFKPIPKLVFLKLPEFDIEFRNEEELINYIKILLEVNNFKEINKVLYELYALSKKTRDDKLIHMYEYAYHFFYEYLKKMKLVDISTEQRKQKAEKLIQVIDNYKISTNKFSMFVRIIKQEFELVPYYFLSFLESGRITDIILEKVKEEIIKTISLKNILRTDDEQMKIENEFRNKLLDKLAFLFPDISETSLQTWTEYIKLITLGLGEIEVLLWDKDIEEVVINNANEPVWVYHRKHAWVKTNIIPKDEETIKHYASLAGRIVNRDITLLNPLLDAHLRTGDRINATLSPITTKGNSITIRKYVSSPWTITGLIKQDTINYDTAALIWMAIQYELSLLIVGGTGSGKTSTLNVICNYFPPNHRIVSIEDTRELQLSDTMHWVPMQTRKPNPEGQGEISMLDLIVNALRMRPDRMIVGEIRRKEEAEVLFEAMHTGHSVYATLHANSVPEALMRITNPPINLPKNVLNSLALLIVQNRNRRTGERKTFQVAEVTEEGDANMLYELDVSSGKMNKVNRPVRLYKTLKQFSGLTEKEIDADIDEKKKLLKYFVDMNIDDVHEIGSIISDYYSNKEFLFKRLYQKKNKTKKKNDSKEEKDKPDDSKKSDASLPPPATIDNADLNQEMQKESKEQ